MTERLIIRILEDQAEWLLLRGNTVVASRPRAPVDDALRALPPSQDERRTLLLVPGEAVLLTRAEIPAQQSRYLDQVLAYAVEEQLAEDVTALHLVGMRGVGSSVNVAAVRREALAQWLEMLEEYGVAPECVLAETLCLPAESRQWSAVLEEGRLVARCGVAAGCVLTQEEWPALAAMAGRSEQSLLLMHSAQEGEQAAALAQSLAQASGRRLTVSLRPVPMGALEVLARGYLAQEDALAGLNLRQGEFAARTAVSSAAGWRKLALVAAVWFGLIVLLNAGKWLYLEYKLSRVEMQQVELYKILFPNEKRIVNAYAQMKNRLSSGSSSDGFSLAVQQLASAWQSIGAANAVQFSQVRYDAEKNELVATVLSADVGTLENFRRALEQAGWLVELSSATRQQDKMQGVIRISGQGGKG